MTYRPARFAGCLGCLGVSLCLLLAALAIFAFGPYLPLRSFDAERWRAVTRSDDQARVQMVEQLLWSRKLDGLTKAQVVSLLGPDNSASGYFDDWDLVYWLGDERSWLSIDSEWLVIRFGSDGHVVEYGTVSD